jgi:hypothetical protein
MNTYRLPPLIPSLQKSKVPSKTRERKAPVPRSPALVGGRCVSASARASTPYSATREARRVTQREEWRGTRSPPKRARHVGGARRWHRQWRPRAGQVSADRQHCAHHVRFSRAPRARAERRRVLAASNLTIAPCVASLRVMVSLLRTGQEGAWVARRDLQPALCRLPRRRAPVSPVW